MNLTMLAWKLDRFATKIEQTCRQYEKSPLLAPSLRYSNDDPGSAVFELKRTLGLYRAELEAIQRALNQQWRKLESELERQLEGAKKSRLRGERARQEKWRAAQWFTSKAHELERARDKLGKTFLKLDLMLRAASNSPQAQKWEARARALEEILKAAHDVKSVEQLMTRTTTSVPPEMRASIARNPANTPLAVILGVALLLSFLLSRINELKEPPGKPPTGW